TQPQVLVVPRAVLIIKHTKAAHREIREFLKQVQGADRNSWQPKPGGGFFRSFPGAMSQIPDRDPS
ncbi:MAG: hypothetical protein KF861_20465, partial [Planctomycetaceae bacterium]|nr:hypothetical protein [Planctomycetaceae bacterium]